VFQHPLAVRLTDPAANSQKRIIRLWATAQRSKDWAGLVGIFRCLISKLVSVSRESEKVGASCEKNVTFCFRLVLLVVFTQVGFAQVVPPSIDAVESWMQAITIYANQSDIGVTNAPYSAVEESMYSQLQFRRCDERLREYKRLENQPPLLPAFATSYSIERVVLSQSEAGRMSQDPRKTWKYFAKAAIQEENPEKLTHLIQQLYRALAEDDRGPFRKPPKSDNGLKRSKTTVR
jgi:hypothetical protein